MRNELRVRSVTRLTGESQISLTFKGFSSISLIFLKLSNFPDPAQNSLTFPVT